MHVGGGRQRERRGEVRTGGQKMEGEGKEREGRREAWGRGEGDESLYQDLGGR